MRRNALFIDTVSKIVEVDDKLVPFAESEDKWESLVRSQMRSEGLDESISFDGHFGTYRWSTQLSKVWLETRADKIWVDWVARGKALQELVEEEEALAQQEKGESPTLPTRATDKASSATSQAMVGTSSSHGFSSSSITKEERPNGETQTFKDPFLSPKWTAAVAKLEAKHQSSNKKSWKSEDESESNDDGPMSPSEWLINVKKTSRERVAANRGQPKNDDVLGAMLRHGRRHS